MGLCESEGECFRCCATISSLPCVGSIAFRRFAQIADTVEEMLEMVLTTVWCRGTLDRSSCEPGCRSGSGCIGLRADGSASIAVAVAMSAVDMAEDGFLAKPNWKSMLFTCCFMSANFRILSTGLFIVDS